MLPDFLASYKKGGPGVLRAYGPIIPGFVNSPALLGEKFEKFTWGVKRIFGGFMTIISLVKQYVYMLVRAKRMCISTLAPRGASACLAISTDGKYVFLYICDAITGSIRDTSPLYAHDFYYLPDTMKKLLAPYLRPYKKQISKEYWRFL